MLRPESYFKPRLGSWRTSIPGRTLGYVPRQQNDTVVFAPYVQNRVDNAGTRALRQTGNLAIPADGTEFTLSGWWRFDSGPSFSGTQKLFQLSADGNPNVLTLRKTPSVNQLVLQGVNLTSGLSFTFQSQLSVQAGIWYHISAKGSVNGNFLALTLNNLSRTDPLTTWGDIDKFQWASLPNHEVNLGAEPGGVLVRFNGSWADIVFDPSILPDPTGALTWNNGVPKSLQFITSRVKITGQNAASHAAGTANINGTGGPLVQVGTGNWVDV